ncbi:hypothetical protein [Anaerovibrio lipolyticus]|uniref:hypothetical protein n=1 Tax=Anaerovibrio lipolyticus TaxID=82374 RepID=UPI0025DD87E2|nr:hypothetical protein [Anaerovibrio lipolyticus]
MFKHHISAGIASFLLCTSVMVGLPTMADAATSVNIDRDDVVYHRVADTQSKKQDFEYVPQQGIKVGYIITGDYEALLDDNTMGYIRRVLHTKFPGARYPMERMENIDGHIHMGRRNTGDTFILSEAHDVLALEFEKLENMYKRIPRKTIVKDSQTTSVNNGISLDYSWSKSSGGASGGGSSSSASASADAITRGIYGGIDTGTTDSETHSDYTIDIDSLGADNSYDFTPHLTTLPKDDYVQFARELEEEGLGGYDYLIMFNIKPLKSVVKGKLFGSTRQSDFRLSVRAIDVATGRYIDRGEYLSRGTSSSANISLPFIGNLGPGPSWRRAMRKSLIDAMIKSFDHMPIGKYSICDNPYCARRQDEIRMESVFGKSHRHCVKHCNDRTFCGDHMVSYQIDADLPSGYVKGQSDELYIRD